MKTFYLYRHVDSIKNLPFYIGIGTNNNYLYYYRSKDKIKRSEEWINYVKSIDYNYEVEILFETTNRKLIVDKEIEFIKLYGRIDLRTGSLVNKNGGNGIGELSDKTIINMIKKQKYKEIIVYDRTGNKIGIFDRAASAAEFTGVSYLSVKQCIMKKHKQSKGFRFIRKEEELDFLPPIKYKRFNRDTPLICKNVKTGDQTIFSNMGEASKKLNIPLGTIGNNLNGTTKFARKMYKFQYVEESLKQKNLI